MWVLIGSAVGLGAAGVLTTIDWWFRRTGDRLRETPEERLCRLDPYMAPGFGKIAEASIRRPVREPEMDAWKLADRLRFKRQGGNDGPFDPICAQAADLLVAQGTALEKLRVEKPPLDLGGARDALHSIMGECEGHRYGKPGYDLTLDHIYDCAQVVLDALPDE